MLLYLFFFIFYRQYLKKGLAQARDCATLPVMENSKEKLWQLNIELQEEETRKKQDAKIHREEIKRIKDEIKDILAEDEDAN